MFDLIWQAVKIKKLRELQAIFVIMVNIMAVLKIEKQACRLFITQINKYITIFSF